MSQSSSSPSSNFAHHLSSTVTESINQSENLDAIKAQIMLYLMSHTAAWWSKREALAGSFNDLAKLENSDDINGWLARVIELLASSSGVQKEPIQTQNEQLQVQNDQLQTQNERLQKDIAQLHTELDEQNKQQKKLKQEYEQYQMRQSEQNSVYDTNVQTKQGTIEQLQLANDKLRSQNAQLQTQLTQLHTQNRDYISHLESIQSRNGELETTVRSLESEIRQLRLQLQTRKPVAEPATARREAIPPLLARPNEQARNTSRASFNLPPLPETLRRLYTSTRDQVCGNPE